MPSISDKTLQALAREARANRADLWRTDEAKQRGTGRLRVRASAGGQCTFYFRYSDSRGKEDQLTLGTYDAKGVSGLTLAAARGRAGELSKIYQDKKTGTRDLRALLEHDSAEKKVHMESAAKARTEAERQAKSGSLQKLLDGYVAHLTRQGKQSAPDARNIFRRNVADEFPELAERRAADVTHRDISAVIARLIDRGAGRTASKLRSYLRAAWACALSAESDPTIHGDLHGFNLTHNPAAAVSSKNLTVYNMPRERVLNEAEMRAFLGALDKETGVARDAVLLSLYLGGQRSAQLVRLKPGDVDLEASTLTLYDGKGSRKTPRVHVLPLTERAKAIVQGLMDTNKEKPFLITLTSRGKNAGRTVPIRTETMAAVVTDISAAMVEAKTAREPFEHRDIRRTCETMMARMGISKETRAHVLSHGLGGVQARHYDRHDYLDEKRRALELWDAKLRQIASGDQGENVVQLQASRAAA